MNVCKEIKTRHVLLNFFSAGCLNGGGQVKASPGENQKELLQKVEELYKAEQSLSPEDDTRVAELYQTWLHSVGEEKAKELLHTQYHTVEKMTNGLTMKWWWINEWLQSRPDVTVLISPVRQVGWGLMYASRLEPLFQKLCALQGETAS